MRGTVRTWNSDRGFGFIRPVGTNGDDDVFVHFSAFPGRQAPDIGADVEFDVAMDSRVGKPKAVNVQILKCSAES